MNTHPPLTFACELDSPDLVRLFDQEGLLETLQVLSAGVALGIRDLSAERAGVVRKLIAAGIPVTAWLLLPEEQGYWFNLDNYPYAERRYFEFLDWSQTYGLSWQRIGLDIEPDIGFLQEFKKSPLAGLQRFVGSLRNRSSLRLDRNRYLSLVHQIQSDGFAVESYQLPYILDARRTQSSLLQRLTGVIDLPVDHEVLMLYSSFERPFGPALLAVYGQSAQAVGIGSTGGGVDLEGVADTRPMSWAEFEQDLLHARQLGKDIFIFSLEGCVRQGFLEKLKTFDWQKKSGAANYRTSVNLVRQALDGFLWLTARPWMVLLILAGLVLFSKARKKT